LYGLAAIEAANGWAMSIVGALIVFTGLVILSFVISKLHTLVELLEGKHNRKSASPNGNANNKPDLPDAWPTDIRKQADLYQNFSMELGTSFQLKQLYSKAKENDMPHPHLTISGFREGGILVSLGDGIFSWNLH
jgi:hypothetical protein